jgi:hypothetical protein
LADLVDDIEKKRDSKDSSNMVELGSGKMRSSLDEEFNTLFNSVIRKVFI